MQYLVYLTKNSHLKYYLFIYQHYRYCLFTCSIIINHIRYKKFIYVAPECGIKLKL